MKTPLFKSSLLCAAVLFSTGSFADRGGHGHVNVPGFLNGPNQFRFIEAGVATRGVAAGPATSALIPVIGPPGAIKVSAPSAPAPGTIGLPTQPVTVTEQAGAAGGSTSIPGTVEGLLISEMRGPGVPESKQLKGSGKRFVPYCE